MIRLVLLNRADRGMRSAVAVALKAASASRARRAQALPWERSHTSSMIEEGRACFVVSFCA